MCGASQGQTNTANTQSSIFNTMNTEAQAVFGQNSDLYQSLLSTFAPIFAAGPNQQGFSEEENAALNTQATEGTAANFAKAERAAGEEEAGAGGGNEYIPSGQAATIKGEIASEAASQESQEQTQIEEENYATGRQNFNAAAEGMLNAGSVFAPSENLLGETTTAGTAVANTENQIAQENNSWMGAVGGLLGAGLSGWAQGGFKIPG